MKSDDFQLCYINRQEQLVFTDNFKNQWGDDWNDSFWMDTSGEPYEIYPLMDSDFNKNRGHLMFVGVRLPYDAELPPEDVSVKEINSGKDYPWIRTDKGNLYAGITYKEAKKLLKKLSIPHALIKFY